MNCDSETALREAMRALRGPEGGLREAMALVRLGPVSIPALIEASRDGQRRIRGLACFALGSLGTNSETVVAALRQCLDDDDEQVRFVAAQALGAFKMVSAEVLARLHQMRSDDQSLSVQNAAHAALEALGESPGEVDRFDEYLAAMQSADPQTREAAIDALRLGGETSGRDDVVRAIAHHLVHDEYYQCRMSAALALGKIGQADSVALSALTTALSDRHPLVAVMAAQTLGSFGPKAISALAALRVLAADTQHTAADTARQAIVRIAHGPA